jgi:growth factor-regulated tyrosine kinase substrate
MDNLVSILNIQNLNSEVKATILRHIQNWGVAFEGKPSLSYSVQVYKNLQQESTSTQFRTPAMVNIELHRLEVSPEGSFRL